MKNTAYLFYGFGAEYVLHPLFEELKKAGETCIEIDALAMKNARLPIRKLKNEPTVLITSAHLLLDQKNFTDFYPTKSKFYSPLEIIKLLSPEKSIFIPHDLTQPFIKFEDAYLNNIDLFFSPCEPFTSIYSQYCPTEEIGWIKYKNSRGANTEPRRKDKAIWFLSDFILYIKIGKEKSFNKLSPVLKQGVAIKFPLWNHSDEFEEYFKRRDVSVFPASQNSAELIESHDIILTNGLSSIIAESYFLGKPTVNIQEDSYYADMLDYLKSSFKSVNFLKKIKDFDLSKIPIKTRKPTLKPFDMKRAIDLIVN